MAAKQKVDPYKYCPRCDRKFTTMKLMEFHLKRAHPDFVEMYGLYEDIDQKDQVPPVRP